MDIKNFRRRMRQTESEIKSFKSKIHEFRMDFMDVASDNLRELILKNYFSFSDFLNDVREKVKNKSLQYIDSVKKTLDSSCDFQLDEILFTFSELRPQYEWARVFDNTLSLNAELIPEYLDNPSDYDGKLFYSITERFFEKEYNKFSKLVQRISYEEVFENDGVYAKNFLENRLKLGRVKEENLSRDDKKLLKKDFSGKKWKNKIKIPKLYNSLINWIVKKSGGEFFTRAGFSDEDLIKLRNNYETPFKLVNQIEEQLDNFSDEDNRENYLGELAGQFSYKYY